MKLWSGTFLALSSMTIGPTTPNNYTITNGITKEMTGYEFWNTKYYPDSLDISINGQAVKIGNSIEIAQNDTTITVRYDYSFAKGFRKGAKEMLFELNPAKKKYLLNFSWHHDDRITAEGAKLKVAKRVRYKA